MLPDRNGSAISFVRSNVQPNIFQLHFIKDGVESPPRSVRKVALFDENAMDVFASLGNVSLPILFQDPIDFQLAMADIRSRSVWWRTKQTCVAPLGASVQLTIEKTLGEFPLPTKRSLKRRVGSFSLTAIRERVDEDGVRSQVIAEFEGDEYWAEPPKIHGRKLKPVCSNESEITYKTTEVYDPKTTALERVQHFARVIADAALLPR